MIREEEKAIEQVKKLLENANPFTMPPHIYFSLEKVLNLIEKQNKELEIKAKMIDELIPRVVLTIKENEEVLEKQSKSVNKSFIDCIKEYFRKKVENE